MYVNIGECHVCTYRLRIRANLYASNSSSNRLTMTTILLFSNRVQTAILLLSSLPQPLRSIRPRYTLVQFSAADQDLHECSNRNVVTPLIFGGRRTCCRYNNVIIVVTRGASKVRDLRSVRPEHQGQSGPNRGRPSPVEKFSVPQPDVLGKYTGITITRQEEET